MLGTTHTPILRAHNNLQPSLLQLLITYLIFFLLYIIYELLFNKIFSMQMASRLLGRLRNVLASIVSLFSREKQRIRRTHPRISLEKLIKKYKKSSSPHSVYKKILANRLSHQLHHNKLKNHKLSSNSIKSSKATRTKRVANKKKPSTQKQLHAKGHSTQARSTKLLTPKIEPSPADLHTIKQELKVEEDTQVPSFNIQEAETIPCFIPDSLHSANYAPSAPVWTPPPSPRRESDNSPLPPYSSLPSPPLSYESLLMPPPATAPPPDHSFYPRITPYRTLSASSPSFSPSFLSSPPSLASASTIRKQFANNYVPQIKTSVPYLRPPPYSPELPYSHDSPFSRPAPYSPTASFTSPSFPLLSSSSSSATSHPPIAPFSSTSPAFRYSFTPLTSYCK